MSVASRPFDDPRNTYVVENDDPGAFDKRFRGQPGTHTEQRCCRDRAPYLWNGVLWCHECATALEKARDSVADAAGDVVGPVLKLGSKIVAFWPGIGTGISVALAAAGALAMNERIDEIAIDAVSSALPPGPIQISFDASAHITRDIIEGRNPTDSVIAAARSVAKEAGGDVAAAALDQGLAIARGEPISPATFAAIRGQIAQSGAGPLAAFDLAVGIGRGDKAEDVVIQLGRSYLEQAGGRSAVVAFDMGYALAQGAAIQEAGFVALRTLARGNSIAEKAAAFASTLGRANAAGRAVRDQLVSELTDDFRSVGGSALRDSLGDALDRLRIDQSLVNIPPGDLARILGTAEPLARAAQAILRDGVAHEDAALTARLIGPPSKTTTRMVLPYLSATDPRGIKRDAFQTSTTAQSGRSAASFALPDLEAAIVREGTSAGPSSIQRMLSDGTFLPVKVAPVAAPPLVQAARPAGASRSTLAQDVGLGLVIATAAGALLWWSRGRQT